MTSAASSAESVKRGAKGKLSPGWGYCLALAALALAGGLFAWLTPGGLTAVLEPGLLWRRLASPLLRTVAFVALGLLAGQLIESLGWTRRLGVLARPLMRASHLPAEAGASFTAAFASGVAANTFLATAWREGRLDDRQLTLANLLNASLPAFFLHLPSVFFVVYALLGWIALVYFGLTLLAAIARCLAVVLTARFLFPAQAVSSQAAPMATPRGLGLVWRDTWRKFLQRLRRLLIIILPVYVVIFFLAEAGFFKWLGHSLAGLAAWRMLPVEAMSVVVFAVVAEFTSGFAAAGALLQSGGLGWSEVVLALLLGNVVATPVRALRHQLPHYMGIFEPALGLKLVALGQGLRVASVLGVALVFVWWV